MFRIRSLSFNKYKRTSTGRFFQVALLAALLSVGFVAPGFQATNADAGAKRSGVKIGGAKRIKTRSLGRPSASGGHRMMRSSGTRSSGMRMGSRQMGKASGGSNHGSRTYTTRKSVLDGGHQMKSGGKRRLGGQMAHGGSKGGNKLLNSNRNRNFNSNTNRNTNSNTNVNTNTNTNNVTVENNIRLNIGNRQLAKSRSGVSLSASQRNTSTFRQIAGGTRTVVTKRRLRGGGQHYGGGRGVATGFSAGGLVVIAGAGAGAQGSAQIANDDCAYGTYCTIDLGGPKIITYNDVADYYEDGTIDEENIDNLSDEELERRYGAK